MRTVLLMLCLSLAACAPARFANVKEERAEIGSDTLVAAMQPLQTGDNTWDIRVTIACKEGVACLIWDPDKTYLDTAEVARRKARELCGGEAELLASLPEHRGIDSSKTAIVYRYRCHQNNPG